MTSVLGIKPLGIPPAPPHYVARGRLIDALNAGVHDRRLLLLTAPAGYGKSSLLASWAREWDQAVAWLALEPEDNDPERFFRYLLKAWEHEQPDVAERPVGVLLGGTMPGIEPVLSAFIATANEWEARITFVLDDYHVVDDPAIHDAMAALIDHLPPTVRFVIGSRETPPLPVARWRARQELVELGPDDLRLRPDEAEAFLNDALGLALPSAAIAALNEQAEGWFAGLQLVALTIEPGTAPSEAVSGRHRFIADYIREDVLNRLPPDTGDFLVRTSIANRLCAPLAEAITGSSNGQTMLERLEREHLFTVPLDDSREWFRYHRLFADVLRDELARRHQAEVPDLHRRAAEWYLHQDMQDPAFVHAMATGDVELVIQVLERFALLKLFSGHIRALLGWVQELPESWLEAKPVLRLLQVAVLMYSGSVETAIRALEELDQRVSGLGEEDRHIVGRVTAVKCFVACEMNDLPRAEELAAAALDALAPDDHIFRGGVWGALGDVYRRNSRWQAAQSHYLRALPYADTPAGIVQSVSAYGALADLELRRGDLRSAAHYWRRALDTINDPAFWGTQPLPLIGWAYVRHGEILYEWNDLEAAWEALDTGRERVSAGGDPRSIIAGGLLATRLHLARGDNDTAENDIDGVRAIAADAEFPEWRAEMERCQVELWLAQDRLRAAVTWADEALDRDASALPDQEPVTLAVARVLIVKGDAPSTDHALRLLDSLAARSEEEGRTGLRIAALSLRALGLAARGDTTGALASLEPALRLAESEGYVRSFIDLGLPMARLLQEAAARGVMPEYVGGLLAGFGEAPFVSGSAASRLPEPLSERELEVLRSVAAGLTNREIADALYISPETVKKHTGSIYGKLGVRGRTEAIASARELDLLD